MRRISFIAFVRSLLIALVLASVLEPDAARAVAVQAPRMDDAPYDACPHIWEFERGGDTDLYALVLRAKAPTTVDVNVRLFSASKAYALSLPAVAIATPTGTQTLGVRSTAIVIHWPISDEEPSAIVSFGGELANCRAESHDFKDKDTPHPLPVEAFAKLEKSIVGEANVAPVNEVKPDPLDPPTCTVDHVKAISDHPVAPEYPEIAKEQFDTGTAIVLVNIDSNGVVHGVETFSTSGHEVLDRAALASANASTYKPGTAACIATAGSYFFRAQFQMGTH